MCTCSSVICQVSREDSLTFQKSGSWSEMTAAAHAEEWVHSAGNSSLPSEACSDEGVDHNLKRSASLLTESVSQITSLDQTPLRKINVTIRHFLLIARETGNWGNLPNLPRLVPLHLSTSSHTFGYFLMPTFSRFSHRGLQET